MKDVEELARGIVKVDAKHGATVKFSFEDLEDKWAYAKEVAGWL